MPWLRNRVELGNKRTPVFSPLFPFDEDIVQYELEAQTLVE